MKEAYQAKQWGFVLDYIRLDIIYKYGGIYLDTDIKLLKKPDELLYQKAFGISDGNSFLNLGTGFGAALNQLIMKGLRDYYHKVHYFMLEDNQYDRTPCFIHQYRGLREYHVKLNDRSMNIYTIIMAATNLSSMQMRISDKSYWAHYGVLSWLDGKYKENKRCFREVLDNQLINI